MTATTSGIVPWCDDTVPLFPSITGFEAAAEGHVVSAKHRGHSLLWG